MWQPEGATNYGYDPTSQLSSVTDWDNDTTIFWFVLQQGPNGSRPGWFEKMAFRHLCADFRAPGEHCDEYPNAEVDPKLDLGVRTFKVLADRMLEPIP